MGENGRLIALAALFVVAAGVVWMVVSGTNGDLDDGLSGEDGPLGLSDQSADPPASDGPAAESSQAAHDAAAAPTSATEFVGAVAETAGVRTGDSATGTGTIHVTLTGPEGTPASGVALALAPGRDNPPDPAKAEPYRAEAESDAEGVYTFVDVPYGNYVIRAAGSGSIQAATAHLCKHQHHNAEVTLQLRTGVPTSGRVFSHDGAPLAGVQVNASDVDALSPNAAGEAQIDKAVATTDSDGHFLFPALWEGQWKFSAEAPGHARTTTGWVSAGVTDVEIHLSQGGAISGNVLKQATDEPAAHVAIVLTSNDPDNFRIARTGADGAFALDGLSNGEYQLAIGDDAMVLAEAPMALPIENGKSITGLTLYVTAGGTISGRVYDKATRAPFAGASVYASANEMGMVEPDNVTTDAEGRYTIAGLGRGVFEIHPENVPGFGWWQLSDMAVKVDVQPGEAYEGIDFAIERGLTVSGVIVEGQGSPVADAHVIARAELKYSTVKAGDNGAWIVAGFSAGDEIDLTADASGLAALPSETVAMGNEDIKGIEIHMIPEATISGRVVDSTGAPVVEAGVEARLIEGQYEGVDRVNAETKSDGAFTLHGMLGGTWHLFGSPTIYGHSTPTDEPDAVVTLRDGEQADGIELVIERPTATLTISGRITDSAGAPIEGARIHGFSPSGGVIQGQSGPDGAYELTQVAEGTYYLSVSRTGYTDGDLEANAGDAGVDVVLEGTTTVSGRVLSASSSQPVQRFTVEVQSGTPDLFMMYGSDESRLITHANGEFRLDGVSTGESTLRVTADGFAAKLVSLGVLVADQEHDGVEVRLDAGASIRGTVTDAAGEPIAGAKLYDNTAPMWDDEARPLAVSDREGRFSADNVTPEASEIRAVHANYATGKRAVALASGMTHRVDIVMPTGAIVEGHVTVDGRPAKAAVMVGGDAFAGISPAMTDDAGFYRVTGVASGTVMIFATTTEGERTRSVPATTEEGMTTVVDIEFGPANAALEGTIWKNGAPVAEAMVSVSSIVADIGGESSTTSNARGEYRFDNLPEGPMRVMVVQFDRTATDMMRGMEQRTASADLVAGEITQLDIELGAGQTIRGSVTGMPEGYMGTVMVLTPEADLDGVAIDDTMAYMAAMQCCMVATGFIDESGAFSVGGIDPGEYQVFTLLMNPELVREDDVFAATLQTHASVEVREGEDATVELVLP